MDARGRLAQEGEHQGVHGVDTGHLEVVRLRVRRDAREQELGEVGVLAFVAIEWKPEEPDADRRRGADDQRDEDSGPQGRARPLHLRGQTQGAILRCTVIRGPSRARWYTWTPGSGMFSQTVSTYGSSTAP